MRSTLLVGFGAWAFTWGAVLVNGTPARAYLPPGVFAATVTGAVEARPRGAAVFGAVAQDGGAATLSIALTSPAHDGAVVLTARSGERPRPGRSYRISASGGPGTFSALYVAGSTERPTGVFRATTGTIEILGVDAGRIEARFRLEARGFLAAAPDEEGRTVAVTGWFTAESHPVAMSATSGTARLP